MARMKSISLKLTVVLVIVMCFQSVFSRPQESVNTANFTSTVDNEKSTENVIRESSQSEVQSLKDVAKTETTPPASSSSPRDVKSKSPVIGEAMKIVANQLLDGTSNTTVDAPIMPDTRIPPKLKHQLAHKHKIKTRHEEGGDLFEKSHAGVAVPISIEELETENKISVMPNESSTSNEGISTWILLSNPVNDSTTTSTEPTKSEDVQKKQKVNSNKNKTKRPQTNKTTLPKRPIIGSTNKADLVAGGSAINDKVYNKIKDTVLSNVEKNKNSPTKKTTTVSSTSAIVTSTDFTPKTETISKTPPLLSSVPKVTSKPIKKKNKNKVKVTTTLSPVIEESSESASLPMEPKEQEIELEVSTPATTTKKPKRSSTKKKNKTKKRKTSKPKLEVETSGSEVKTGNKTKSVKPPKKQTTDQPLTSQIYSYFSREVMPSVGVGVIGLASLVGLASYFLYPFSVPVRRTFEVDKKDDLYKHNAEEYASEGHGQAEEEMLGTVLAGMPAHAKHKLNPYAGQTAYINRYPVKKEQDIRYRHVTASYEPNYNVRYPQQKTGIAHGAIYPESVNYNPQYETRHAHTTESTNIKYTYNKPSNAYTPYPAPALEQIYAAPQTGPSGLSSFGSDTSNSVVYGVKPSADTDFKPVYPFEGQFGQVQYSETTSSPTHMTYPPTSMYLGSNNEPELEQTHNVDNDGDSDNKFVVGNVPKELVDTATPAVVPEHGPRKLRKKRSITGSIEEILRQEKEKNKDIFISNEIDDVLGHSIKYLAPQTELMPMNDVIIPSDNKEPFSLSPDKNDITPTVIPDTTQKDTIIENVSTLPIDYNKVKSTTNTETSNELDTTTKVFRVYEVFSNPTEFTEKSNTLKEDTTRIETTTQFRSANTETTTDSKSEITSIFPSSPTLNPITETSSVKPFTTRPTLYPEVITYPPINQEGGFFSFLKRLIEFKYKLGLSILQTTSDSLNRYLRNMEDKVQKVAEGSQNRVHM